MDWIATIVSGEKFPPGILAQLEFLVFVVIILVSAFFNWLKKKSEDAQEWTDVSEPEQPREQPGRRPRQRGPAAPPPIKRPAERKTFDWEEELRRMLEGGQAKPAPAQPPPVIVSPKQEPPPQYKVVPPTARPAAPPRKTSRVVVPNVRIPEAPAVPVVSLQPGNVAFERGGYAIPTRGGISLENQRARALFRNAVSARQAVIASVVIGPPKAMEMFPERII